MTPLIPTDRQDFENRLHALAESLDVPPSAYEQAEARYSAVSSWLCADGSPLARFNPRVYPQGSFALGTVIRPPNCSDYDVDAVVQLDGSPRSWTPSELKQALGDRLRGHDNYKDMMGPEGRRCWTLEYASGDGEPGFHMDLLAAVLFFGDDVSGIARTATAIAITNKLTVIEYDWRESDPKAYQAWFKKRVDQEFKRFATEKRAEIEALPQRAVRSTLQRTVQILKHHRDTMFNGYEHAPISIIITTLAARAYHGDDSLADTVVSVTKGMRGEIEWLGDQPVIRNPVRPEENFADRWEGAPQKRDEFFKWLTAAEKLAEEIERAPAAELERTLAPTFGEAVAKTASAKYDAKRTDSHAPRLLLESPPHSAVRSTGPLVRLAAAKLPALWDNAPHRAPLAWPYVPDGTRVAIAGRVTGGSGARLGALQSGQTLAPQADLEFQATFVERPGDVVYWQIVNTGDQAKNLGQLRGSFELATSRKVETARYLGDHFTECFIIRGGRCVARSGPFTVRVR